MTRETSKYHFKLGNRIVHTGITNNLARASTHMSTVPSAATVSRLEIRQKELER